MVGRLEVLKILVSEHDIAKVGLPVNVALDFVVKHCLQTSSDKKMRELAMDVILGLYERLSYKRVEPYVSQMARHHKEVLRAKMPELDEALPEKKVYEAGTILKMVKGEETGEPKPKKVDPRAP